MTVLTEYICDLDRGRYNLSTGINMRSQKMKRLGRTEYYIATSVLQQKVKLSLYRPEQAVRVPGV
jgi:hypothetical protein